MATNQQLSFLQERIEEIGSAIFYNLSDSVLKLPTSIITSLKVDEYGFVWFCVQKPSQHLTEFEQEFPVKLDFYKKGKGYFLQIDGKAFVVTDPEEMNAYVNQSEDIKKFANNSVALLKVKIQKAEYYQTKTSTKSSWWQTAYSTLTSWLGTNPYRSGHTYFPAS